MSVDADSDGERAALLCRALDAELCCPVRHRGELLAVLAVTGPDRDALGGRDRAMFNDIADHAGLVVHNAVLTIGLARQAEERAEMSDRLRDVRRRLVAAQDTERRRLERNLHDGAQQALVATLIGLRSIGPASGSHDVAELRDILAIAQTSLAELTGARYPAVLLDAGLVGAVEQAAAMTRRLGTEVVVDAQLDDDSIDPDVALAIYFCCVEALQNLAKYAHASCVVITLADKGGEVVFVVADDGVGFDRTGTSAEGGLAELDARLAAVGGRLSVQSRIGVGTRVTGRVSVRSPAARM
jgi:signal transduction histidine kinase